MSSLLATLERLRLVKEAPASQDEGPAGLLRWCDAGLLEGGLTVALDVAPDELVGALVERLGGTAARLKVLECRTAGGRSLTVSCEGRVETWAVPDVPTLVHHLNRFFRGDARVRRCAVLGEWEDALQLWCLAPEPLKLLLREPAFQPVNRGEL